MSSQQDVDGIDQAVTRERRQPLPRNHVDVVIGAARELRRHRMRAEEARRHRHREIAAPSYARGAQHARFGIEREPVAGLDLDAGHAFGEQRGEPRSRGRRTAAARSRRAWRARSRGSRRRRARCLRSSCPRVRCANSAARCPAKTRCVWQSTRPGVSQRPARSIVRSARVPAGSSASAPTHAMRPRVREHRRRARIGASLLVAGRDVNVAPEGGHAAAASAPAQSRNGRLRPCSRAQSIAIGYPASA